MTLNLTFDDLFAVLPAIPLSTADLARLGCWGRKYRINANTAIIFDC
jgi:hypothetical protein